jgi:hypothetical protein
MTNSLYNQYKYTTEKVSGFYVSSDDKSLVVIGEKFHYIFPLETKLKSVLNWKERLKVKATFSQFKVFPDSIVNGAYYLVVDAKDLGLAEQEYLKSIGFDSDYMGYHLDSQITGKYYAANGILSSSQFNQPYTIELAEDASMPGPLKVALTPITVAADGVLWIGGAILAYVVLTPYCIVSERLGNKCFPSGL